MRVPVLIMFICFSSSARTKGNQSLISYDESVSGMLSKSISVAPGKGGESD